MQLDSTPQMVGVGYAAQRVTKPPNWHTLVAWDMLLNNLSTGLFLVAAVGDLVAPDIFGPTTRLAYPIALLVLLADLLCLVLDLGDPLRFHHMLRVFKPSSPMSFGTWCLTAYSLPLTLLTAIESLRALGVEAARGPIVGGIRLLAVVLGVPFAFGSAAYKGVLFSTTAQPGWRDARWLGGYLVNSAFLLGCGALTVLSLAMGQERASALLRPTLPLLLLLNLIPLGLLIAEVLPELRHRYTPEGLIRLGAACLGGGVLIPVALLVVGSPLAVLAAVMFLLAGNLAIRFAIVSLPHPAHRQGHRRGWTEEAMVAER